MYTESAHFPTFAAETETENEIEIRSISTVLDDSKSVYRYTRWHHSFVFDIRILFLLCFNAIHFTVRDDSW